MDYIVKGSKVLDDEKKEYTVLDVIGKGGFGIVFKVKQDSDDNIYALKTLQVGFAQQEYLDSFRHEGESAVKIRHDNVIAYHFFQSENLPPYIIMDFAEGGSLQNFIEEQKSKGFIENSELQKIFLQLIDGIAEINKTIVHRDLKPDNILISNNIFKITDFGLSKVSEDDTRTSTFKGSGTYSYMSPEAWKLETNTVLMDIYSMGLIFYELATLQHPFSEEAISGYEDWKKLHLYKNPKLANEINSNLSPIIIQVIQKMISKIPSQRFQNWNEVKSFLEKEELPKTAHSSVIETILNKKTKEENEKTQSRLEQEARDNQKREKTELVEYMFNEQISSPLKEFVDELNSQVADGKILFNGSSLRNNLRLPNGKNISIECEVIFEENFYRKVPYEWMGQRKYKSELMIPKLRNDKIIAWGVIKSSSNKGYNFVLVEQKDNPYGNWILLSNTNNALSRKERTPEPFCFDYDELEKELPHINALHIYDMKDEIFSLQKIFDLITEEI